MSGKRFSNEIIAAMRAQVSGRRALLVTNRREREIEKRLLQLLGLEIKWVNSTGPRMLQSGKESIMSRGCMFVLVATSFVGHDVDNLLKKACKQTSIHYIMIKKGRLEACLAGLARALDL